jgi:predicted Zn finger-like uncharacterized protein
LLTQCPNCQTTFRITSEILRVAHGQVRCGRCHTQFDALERLIEDEASDDVAPESSPDRIQVEEPAEQEDITLEGRHIAITGTYRALDDPDEPVRQEVTEEWVEFDDVDDEPLAVSDDGIEVDEDISAPDADIADSGYDSTPLGERDRFATRLAAAAAQSRAAEAHSDELELIAPPRRGRSALAWNLLAVPLVLLLLGQIANHYRAELARHPRLGPLVAQVYNAIGLSLMPDWHLHAYEIKQWGVISDPTHPGTLKVRASITNRAPFPQPYPLLKLVLEDRWGDQVRAREFEPAEYLDPGTSTERQLAPGQPVNATITIVDPGADAEGFRFDVCLKGKAPVPVCAAEVPE